MKEITVIFENASTIPLSQPTLSQNCLENACKLLKNLCEDTDFCQRLAEFLKSGDWEVPMVSWQPPPAT